MSAATAINCTQCGAGLNVLGGGRVRAHVCGYCGAELDAQDNYRILRQFKDMKRPESPFEIGMEGEIDGVRMVVIGTIGQEERHAGRSWAWVDHQLYSPTHGYAWLGWENGNVTLTRKTRKAARPAHLSERVIEESESRPTVRLDDRTYTYYASGRSKITFVEGEFNWVPKLGDASRYVSLVSSDQILTIAETNREREYELTTLPDRAALFASFGVDARKWPAPSTVHPLATFGRSPNAAFARNLAFACAGLCLVLALYMMSLGTTIASGATAAGQPLSVPFEVTEGDKLVEVRLSADVDNSWAGLEAEIVDRNDEPVAAFESAIEYYQGYDDGYWSEGSRTASVNLRLDNGEYTLNVAMTEVDTFRSPSTIGVQVWQGVVSSFWLWLGFAVFLLIGAGFVVQRILHQRQRMAGSDWDDE